MKTLHLFLVAVLVAGLSYACGGDDNPVSANDEVTTIEDLAGTWNATSIVYSNKANPSQTIDGMSRGEGRVLKFNSDGSYEMTITFAGFPLTLSGIARIEDKKLILALGDDPALSFDQEYAFTLEGNRLTMTDVNVEVDFNGDGNDEPATEVTVYVKA